MEAVGCSSTPNLWDQPLLLVPDHHAAHADLLKSPDGKSPSARGKGGPAFTILPPEKLMPFVVPFRGGPGRLCGGPAPSAQLMRSDSIGATVRREGPHGGGGVFPFPPAYDAAVAKKIESVARLRAAVKSVCAGDPVRAREGCIGRTAVGEQANAWMIFGEESRDSRLLATVI